VATLNQASAHWTLAQLCCLREEQLSPAQTRTATQPFLHNLKHHADWIVLNMTLKTLHARAEQDDSLAQELQPLAARLEQDPRKSVAKTARKVLAAPSKG